MNFRCSSKYYFKLVLPVSYKKNVKFKQQLNENSTIEHK